MRTFHTFDILLRQVENGDFVTAHLNVTDTIKKEVDSLLFLDTRV